MPAENSTNPIDHFLDQLDLFEIYGLKGKPPAEQIALVEKMATNGELHPTVATGFLRVINFDLQLQGLAAAIRFIDVAGERVDTPLPSERD